MDRNRETVRVSQLDAAATKIQKVYRGHRIRRNLSDSIDLLEGLWCKDLGFAAPERSTESLNIEKQETAVSRWSRIGKGSGKDDRAQKLALQHWLEDSYYHPSEDSYEEFLSFLWDHQVDLTNVKSSGLISFWDQQHQVGNLTNVESPKLTPDTHVISGEWTFLITALCLEILSISFDQAASPSKPRYALFGMILAIAALLICIWELVYKGKKEGVVLRRWGKYLWWFYYPHSTQLFGTLPDFYGLIGSTMQCFCSTVQYVWFSQHADNPIKVSLWPAIFLVCLGAKRLAEIKMRAMDTEIRQGLIVIERAD
ncbi:hypothetical protein ACFX2I_016481 [Malus domestica]